MRYIYNIIKNECEVAGLGVANDHIFRTNVTRIKPLNFTALAISFAGYKLIKSTQLEKKAYQ